tara:strand:+ start:141248 stop:142123 length:876 start_codon:yes stop_codon:yes gene_type:complete
MKYYTRLLMTLVLVPTIFSAASAQDVSTKPGVLKVLIVAGGCCHDYASQTKLLKDGIEQRINADVTVVFNESTETTTTFDIYESDDWADGFDVVIHDECSAKVTDQPYVNRILAAHQSGVPAVNLHCAMHSYRWGDYREPVENGADNAGWYEMIGVQSAAHGPQSPIDVTYVDADHPITKGFKAWKTIDEELYNNIRVFSGTSVLASGDQLQAPRQKELKKNPDARPVQAKAAVAWTNLYGPNKTKIFSTTLGHNNETVGDERYLDLIVRGLLWSTGNLSPEGEIAKAYAK